MFTELNAANSVDITTFNIAIDFSRTLGTKCLDWCLSFPDRDKDWKYIDCIHHKIDSSLEHKTEKIWMYEKKYENRAHYHFSVKTNVKASLHQPRVCFPRKVQRYFLDRNGFRASDLDQARALPRLRFTVTSNSARFVVGRWVSFTKILITMP